VSVHEYGRVPFVPRRTLAKHKAYEATDNRFRAAARLRQALLREQRGWRIGHYLTPRGTRRKLGNYIAPDPEQAANFITPEVACLARREIAFREDGAFIDETRLWRNLLSSAPAVFNFFGPLKNDLRLATRVLRYLCPDLVHRVTEILFEHSPARRHPAFTHDQTAFDALFKCRLIDGQEGFVAVELKYTESMAEPPARLRPRYDELSRSSGLYRDPEHPSLRTNPLQQFWRQHLLAHAMIENGLYRTGRFLVIAPTHNNPVQQATDLYRQQLADPPPSIAFDAVTLESVVAAIKRAGAVEIASLLHERHCDYNAVAALI
jgi:hypothetical protein